MSSTPSVSVFPQLWLRSDGSMPSRSWFLSRLHSVFPCSIGGHSMRAGGRLVGHRGCASFSRIVVSLTHQILYFALPGPSLIPCLYNFCWLLVLLPHYILESNSVQAALPCQSALAGRLPHLHGVFGVRWELSHVRRKLGYDTDNKCGVC